MQVSDILSLILQTRSRTVIGYLWGTEPLALDKLLKAISGRMRSPLFAGYREFLSTVLVTTVLVYTSDCVTKLASFLERRLGQPVDSLVLI